MRQVTGRCGLILWFILLCGLPLYADTITVMTWNCEWLLAPEDVPGNVSMKITDIDAKLAGLVEVIVRNRPDILALQEVGAMRENGQGVDMAARLTRLLGVQGLEYQHITNPATDPLRQHCALLYRYMKIEGEPLWHDSETIELRYGVDTENEIVILDNRSPGKGLLDVMLSRGDRKIRCFVFHTVSKAGGWDADLKRVADGKLIGEIVRQSVITGDDVIACGDFNDDQNSSAFEWLTGTVRARDLRYTGSPLHDLCKGIPRIDDWTYTYDGYSNRIDQVVGRFRQKVAVTARIDHDIPEVNWCDDPKPEPVSDHAPIIVELYWK